jgi:hypothetical protein
MNFHGMLSQIEDTSTLKPFWNQFFSNEKIFDDPAFKVDETECLGLPYENCLRKDSQQVIYYGNGTISVE